MPSATVPSATVPSTTVPSATAAVALQALSTGQCLRRQSGSSPGRRPAEPAPTRGPPRPWTRGGWQAVERPGIPGGQNRPGHMVSVSGAVEAARWPPNGAAPTPGGAARRPRQRERSGPPRGWPTTPGRPLRRCPRASHRQQSDGPRCPIEPTRDGYPSRPDEQGKPRALPPERRPPSASCRSRNGGRRGQPGMRIRRPPVTAPADRPPLGGLLRPERRAGHRSDRPHLPHLPHLPDCP